MIRFARICRVSRLLLATSLCLIVSLMLSSCDITGNVASTESRADKQKARQTLHRVEVITVENKAVSLSQTISGTLEAVTKMRLFNEESGRITQLPYHEGDFVKQGTLLVQLDNALLKTDVSKATATKQQAKLDLSRLKKLLQKAIATEEEVARAQTELDIATAEESRQLIRLQRSSIKAPFDGIISKRLHEPGDMLAAKSHIYTIIDPYALRLRASLAERWLPLIEKGQTVTLSIDALGNTIFPASLLRIHPTINASTHQGTIEVLLKPVPEGAIVGQFSRGKIELSATNRLIIPLHTIHYENKGAYVFRIADDGEGNAIAEKVFFEQGQQFASVTEIVSGLKPGDQIVSRGVLGLRSGKKVEIAKINDKVITAKKIKNRQIPGQSSNQVGNFTIHSAISSANNNS